MVYRQHICPGNQHSPASQDVHVSCLNASTGVEGGVSQVPWQPHSVIGIVFSTDWPLLSLADTVSCSLLSLRAGGVQEMFRTLPLSSDSTVKFMAVFTTNDSNLADSLTFTSMAMELFCPKIPCSVFLSAASFGHDDLTVNKGGTRARTPQTRRYIII